jgi:hypothetical protein
MPRATLALRAVRLLIHQRQSYLHTTGWMESLRRRRPVDNDGGPLPWMNYAAIRVLKERLRDDHVVFEYGTGSSTEFFSRRAMAVTSVEHDPLWHERLHRSLPVNATVILKSHDIDGDYCRSILASGTRYDVVIVDGVDRVHCLLRCADALTARGVVVLDDSDRAAYSPGVSFLLGLGFRAICLEGLKPTGAKNECTTIFYRDGNCFGL